MDSGITVTGSGQAQAPADLLRLHLSIGRDAADVAAAVDAVAEETAAATAALIENGVAAADIRTSSVNVHPQYGDSMRVTGYRAAHSMIVSTADLTGFGRLLSAAIEVVGNDLGVEHLGFDIADKTALVEQARHSAFADARRRAGHLAVLADRQLGRIEAVTEQQVIGPAEPMMFDSMKLSVGRSAAPLAVTPGQQTVEVSLVVQWAWA